MNHSASITKKFYQQYWKTFKIFIFLKYQFQMRATFLFLQHKFSYWGIWSTCGSLSAVTSVNFLQISFKYLNDFVFWFHIINKLSKQNKILKKSLCSKGHQIKKGQFFFNKQKCTHLYQIQFMEDNFRYQIYLY